MEINGFKIYDGPTSKKLDDLTNKIFGRLKVLARGENICGHPAWICECTCGNIVHVSSQNLKRNNTKSCGCWRKEMPTTRRLDISGQRFGLLVAIELDPVLTNQYKTTFWKCRCDCGNELSISLNHLTCNKTHSCGCNKKSYGEQKIQEILENKNINFLQEYSFEDLKSENGYPLRYDFYLLDYNRLIEYDGEQHFKETNYFRDGLEKIQARDLIKNKYAKERGIDLIRIPYTDINKITIKDILSNKYLII